MFFKEGLGHKSQPFTAPLPLQRISLLNDQSRDRRKTR